MPSDLELAGSTVDRLSESDIRVNYGNLSQIIGACNNIGGSAQVQFYSGNGGTSWSQTTLPLVQGDTLHSDPTVDWTSDGTAWAITIGIQGATNQLRCYTSGDGGATWTFDATASGNQTNVDKELMWVDHSATSPYRDNIYVTWHNGGPSYVARRTGPGGAWQAPVQVSGGETSGSIGGDVKTNSNGDVFAFWPDTVSRNLFVAKSTNGGANFGAPVTIATTFAGYEVAIPAMALRQALIYISGGAFHDSASDLVYALWVDLSGEPGCNSGGGPGSDVTSSCKSRIWFSRSTDGGAHWEAARMINNQPGKNDQFNPRMAVDEVTGEIVVMYYDTINDQNRLKTDVWTQTSSDNGVSWTDAAQLSSAETDETGSGADLGNQYGDYNGITGHSGSYFVCWTDRRGGGLEQIWGAPINTTDCQLLIDQNTYGQDEVELQLPGTASFAAGWVQVDGFRPSELLNAGDLSNPLQVPSFTTTLDPTLPPVVASAIQGMLVPPAFAGPVVPTLPSLPDEPQTFFFPFSVGFSNDTGFLAMRNATPAIESTFITLGTSLTVGQSTVSSSGQIELTTGEDPRFIDIDPKNPTQYPSWLSFDLRFFKMVVAPNGTASRFNATMTTNWQDAPGFIAQVIKNLNTGNAAGDTFDPGLTQDEDGTKLEFQQNDNSGNFVFNFAVARVRLLAKSAATAHAVRVFFRLFQAQNTVSNFDPSATTGTYRYATDNVTYGHKIPLLGVLNDATGNPEYVTIPCFATERITLSDPTKSMADQEDLPNAYDLATSPGTEMDYYFGCWLDVNQPQLNVMPASPPAGNLDGPWPPGTLLPLQAAMNSFPHQCLIAEIRFDDTPVPPGANTGNSDKLAQRNIAWLDGPNPGVVASRRVMHPVQVRPTPAASANPDELMILWGSTPPGSSVQLYLPALNAAEILRLADLRYTEHQLRLVDAHTLGCATGGATLIPLPEGTALAAGLLSIDLPPGIHKGDVYTITVRQVTDAAASLTPPPPVITIRAAAAAAFSGQLNWRQVTGAFQFVITISTKEQLLRPEERLLAVMRWILGQTPPQKRWYPVLVRYIGDIAGRVQGFGGDPGTILPSPTGDVPGLHLEPCPPEHNEVGEEITGKVEGIIYDHFGDFEGFILEAESGRHHRFATRELEMRALVRRAWIERTRISVLAEEHHRQVPHKIITRAGGRRCVADLE